MSATAGPISPPHEAVAGRMPFRAGSPADGVVRSARLNYQLSAQDLSRVLQLVVDHEQEIRDGWRSHFGS